MPLIRFQTPRGVLRNVPECECLIENLAVYEVWTQMNKNGFRLKKKKKKKKKKN